MCELTSALGFVPTCCCFSEGMTQPTAYAAVAHTDTRVTIDLTSVSAPAETSP